MPVSHKSGWLKQSNKGHKRAHRSKREVGSSNAGRVNASCGASVGGASSFGGRSARLAGNKAARTSKSVALRRDKRNASLMARRAGGASSGGSLYGAPRTVGVVLLDEKARVPEILGENAKGLTPGLESVTRVFKKEKLRVTFIVASRTNFGVLDVAKVADILLFVLPLCIPDKNATSTSGPGGALDAFLANAIDQRGRDFITLAKAQGLPAVVGVLQNLDQVPKKYVSALKKQASNFFVEEFGPGTKMAIDVAPGKMCMDDGTDPTVVRQQNANEFQFLRALTDTTLKRIQWRSERSYMLCCQAGFDDQGLLKVSGYLRGRPLDVNQLVHIPGKGNYHISRVESGGDPNPLSSRQRDGQECDDGGQRRQVWVADPTRRLPLEEEAAPDPLAGEQTWPTEEETGELAQQQELERLEQERREAKLARRIAKMPPGISDTQKAWLLAVSDSEDDDEEEGGANDQDGDVDMDELMRKRAAVKAQEEAAAKVTLGEWKLRNKKEREQEQVEFPDEVDTPEDIPAKDRFARYRGLKSFRTSPWHPKESLPREYARIFQVDNPVGLQNDILEKGKKLERDWLDGCLLQAENNGSSSSSSSSNHGMETDATQQDTVVPPGQWVSVYIQGFQPSDLIHMASAELPLVWGALLDKENKVSVLNCGILKASSYEQPVRSRDKMILCCGWWRRPVRPCFSEDNANCDKHKFERFLHAGRYSIATVYAPLTFGTNVPTLLCNWSGDLIGSGTVQSLDPDRIILKKIVLSGHPVRIKKNWCVARYMFFNPNDVKWFKPVDLWTKYGSSGRILEPIGTHGLFKASFNKPIKYNDTVCMSLYKRVFPKPVNEFKELQAEKLAEKNVTVHRNE